jgi:hypothetical protein
MVRETCGSFGPFGKPAKGCPDINCIWDTQTLMDPQWSDSGDFLLVRGYRRSYVLHAPNLKIERQWRDEDGHAVFISDSLAMGLSKNHGVTFHRW